MAAPIRVLIVDDHAVMAQALALALGQRADVQVVGVGGTMAEAIHLASQTRPDVVLMDHHLPDGTGAQAAAAIREHQPQVAVVILTADTSDEVLLAAVEAGACGIVLKSQPLDQIVAAVRGAAAGELLIPAATLLGLVGRLRGQAREGARPAGLERLTPRERDVLRLMAQGLDNRAIAARLVLSVHTVRDYVKSILAKLGAHTKLEAIARASQYGLLDPPRPQC